MRSIYGRMRTRSFLANLWKMENGKLNGFLTFLDLHH